jgi:CO/xanthine dehydrogenase FAD-binding subunit
MDEAFRLIRERHGTAIGGAAWLRTNTKTMALGVDLAGLGLEYIREAGERIEIGAMTTYRELETSQLLKARFGPLFEATVSHVVGIQLRNIITVGGTVAGRYGFSDLNTTLCALGAKAVFYPGQTVDLADFIEKGAETPFLLEKILLPASMKASYQQMRISENDFPIINTASAGRAGLAHRGRFRGPRATPSLQKGDSLLGDVLYPSTKKLWPTRTPHGRAPVRQ